VARRNSGSLQKLAGGKDWPVALAARRKARVWASVEHPMAIKLIELYF
jgi:hypothetical protein